MKDFGSILDSWEQKNGTPGSDLIEKTEEYEGVVKHRISGRRLPIDDTIDLHGMTLEQACNAVDDFLRAAVQQAYQKVLIIHGKGTHTSEESEGGVLRSEIRKYLELHPLAGETGVPKIQQGGEGAVWVLVRQLAK